MKNIFTILCLLISITIYSQSEKPELVIATERVEPGILFIFEGAIKDNISPSSMHLSENETNIHIEAMKQVLGPLKSHINLIFSSNFKA